MGPQFFWAQKYLPFWAKNICLFGPNYQMRAYIGPYWIISHLNDKRHLSEICKTLFVWSSGILSHRWENFVKLIALDLSVQVYYKGRKFFTACCNFQQFPTSMFNRTNLKFFRFFPMQSQKMTRKNSIMNIPE